MTDADRQRLLTISKRINKDPAAVPEGDLEWAYPLTDGEGQAPEVTQALIDVELEVRRRQEEEFPG